MEPKDSQFSVDAKFTPVVEERPNYSRSSVVDTRQVINKNTVEDNKSALKKSVKGVRNVAAAMGLRPKSHEAVKTEQELRREVGTANHALKGITVAELEEMAAKGRYTQVSGDALARTRRGVSPKLGFTMKDAKTGARAVQDEPFKKKVYGIKLPSGGYVPTLAMPLKKSLKKSN